MKNARLFAHSSPVGALTMLLINDACVKIDLNEATSFDTKPEGIFARFAAWFDAYFAGERPSISDLPIMPEGTEFQKKVWDYLLSIPYGNTKSYGEISEALSVNSAQAVGQAVAANPLPIIVPCHRVLGASELGGYAYGPDVKKYLLDLENISLP